MAAREMGAAEAIQRVKNMRDNLDGAAGKQQRRDRAALDAVLKLLQPSDGSRPR